MIEQTINVLLVEDNPGDARLIQEMLAETNGSLFRLTRAERLSTAIDALTQGGINIILLDLGLPDSEGIETFRKVHAGFSDIPIVVLSGMDDEAFATEAVREGAQDYLVKDQVNARMLSRAIRYALERYRVSEKQKPANHAKIIGFIGSKGGVGTSTVALNIASALARGGKDVIAVELRSSLGTFSLALGLKPNRNLRHLNDEFQESSDLTIEKILFQTDFGLQLLFGPQEATDIINVIPDFINSTVNKLADITDYVIIDMQLSTIDILKTFTTLCDSLIVVVDHELYSVESGRFLLSIFDSLEVNPNMIGVVGVNRSALPISLRADEISSILNKNIVGVVPFSHEMVLLCQKKFQPIVICQPENIAAFSLFEIANKLA
jgi:MinD-like ATPase involved in chromosome partitioning or flagellar assembly/CheY-like chemotaxis protein